MKLTYTQRTGHARTRFARKKSSLQARKRRKRAMKRLEAQLEDGHKIVTEERKDVSKELTEEDRRRIKKEIETLKTRL